MKNGAGRKKLLEEIQQEKRHIDKTLEMLLAARRKRIIHDDNLVAMSVYIRDVYMGIENVIRRILQEKGISIVKTDSWHKELLSKSVECGAISEGLRETLVGYLNFRHLQTHGYSHMMKWEKMKPLADKAEDTANRFFSELKQNGYSS